jgi:hypothetical protein
MSKSTSAKATTKPTKTVKDIDVNKVTFGDLEYAPIALLIDTYEHALKTKTSPIIDISSRSYAKKTPAGGKEKSKNSGKVYEFSLAVLCTDDKLYKLGGSGEDDDIGKSGLQGGVKSPDKRQYGLSVMFKTKTNLKLGKCLELMSKVLVNDTTAKINNKTIVTKNKSITDPVKSEIESGTSEEQKEYADGGDYIVRMNVITRGPEQTRLFEDKIVDQKVDDDDIEMDSGRYIHTSRIEFNEDNAHTLLTRSMGMEYFEFGVTRKQHGFGVSFNIYLSTVFPIPRSISFEKDKPKTNRSMDKRLKFAEKAAERAKIISSNTSAIRERSNNPDGDEANAAGKKRNNAKKEKKPEPPPERSETDEDFSDESGSDE